MHVIAYLGHKFRLTHNPTYPEIICNNFKVCDWADIHRNIKEPLPINAPKPTGREVDIHMFMDSDHVEDIVSHIKI